jgi:hypothetical protein
VKATFPLRKSTQLRPRISLRNTLFKVAKSNHSNKLRLPDHQVLHPGTWTRLTHQLRRTKNLCRRHRLDQQEDRPALWASCYPRRCIMITNH